MTYIWEYGNPTLPLGCIPQLSLCCQRFYDLAKPLLYETIPQITPRKSYAFLRTIVGYPDVALLVREFYWLYWDDAEPDNPASASKALFESIMNKDDIERCRKVVRDLTFKKADIDSVQWLGDIESGDLESTITLLLCLLPNLRQLTLRGPMNYEDIDGPQESVLEKTRPRYIPKVIARAANVHGLLQQSHLLLSTLRHVELINDGYGLDDPVKLDFLVQLFRNKSITTLSLNGIDTNTSPPDLIPFAAVTKLSTHSCELGV
jgi:hypothetical protein